VKPIWLTSFILAAAARETASLIAAQEVRSSATLSKPDFPFQIDGKLLALVHFPPFAFLA